MADEALNDAAKALLAEPVVANIATVDAEGRPHLTPVWVDIEGDNVVINTAEGRVKLGNLCRTPAVAVSVVDPQDPYRVVAFIGTVIDITDRDADAHIDRLARTYLGVDRYPMRQPGERRLRVTIGPDRVLMQPPSGGGQAHRKIGDRTHG